jgi:probable selenium-dependent hydroxylase accessory protein YqeC
VSLLAALRLGRGDVVALAGAGGKTTLAYALCAEARAAGLRVLVTTTTHMGTLSESVTGPVFIEGGGDLWPEMEAALAREGRATLLGRRVREDKIEGVRAERVDELAGRADLVVVEADGARSRSLKVPAAHEPVVPASTTLLLVLVGLDVLGAPLDEGLVHRLELVEAATGRSRSDPVGEPDVVAALLAPQGYLDRAGGRRAAVFFNKDEDPARGAAAARMAARLVPPYALVAAGSAQAGRAEILAG